METVNELGFRRNSFTEAASQFPNGLILIEKEIKKTTESNESIVSEDVLFMARREAQRLRTIRQRSNENIEPVRSRAQSAKVSPIKSVPAPRAQSANLNVKSIYTAKRSPSKIETRTTAELGVQLQHLRDEIEGLAAQLTEEVPSEIEDVDTAFDDESKRWFARELYSIKLECDIVRRMPLGQREKQTHQIIKLHRTAHRLIQVAASRPILRILNPHIYSDLGGLIQELLKISDYLDMPAWDPTIILTALEEAVLFPSRKNSKQNLVHPKHIAQLIGPKKTVARKSSIRAPPQKGKEGPNRFFDEVTYGAEYKQQLRPVSSKNKLKSSNSSSKTKLSKKSKSKSNTSIHSKKGVSPKKNRPKSAIRERDVSASCPRSKSARSKTSLLQEISLSGGESDQLPPVPQSQKPKSVKYGKVDIRKPQRTRSTENTKTQAAVRKPKVVAPGYSTESIESRGDYGYEYESPLENIENETIQEFEKRNNIDNKFWGKSESKKKNKQKLTQADVAGMMERLETVDRETDEIRLRLQRIHAVNDEITVHSPKPTLSGMPSYGKSSNKIITFDPQKYNKADDDGNDIMKKLNQTPSAEAADEIVRQAIIEARQKEVKTKLEEENSEVAMVDEVTKMILDDAVDDVFDELESALDEYVSEVYDSEVHCDGPDDETNTLSLISADNSIQNSFQNTQ